jgi:hypothetical protein
VDRLRRRSHAATEFISREANVRVEIRTLWRTATEQCEFVILGLRGCRLRLWVKGALIVDEQVFDWADVLARAAELRIEWPRLVE